MKKRKEFSSSIILILLLLSFIDATAQPVSPPQKDSQWNVFIDISKIRLVKPISKNISSAYISKNQSPATDFSGLSFIPGLKHTRNIPNDFVTKKAVLKFNICNSSDSAVSAYFFPGFYYTGINLYRVNGSAIQHLPAILPDINDSVGYRLINLAAHDSATILAELTFLKTYINTIRPRLLQPEYLESFIAELRSTHNEDNLVTYIFCGLLLMMILYSLANFFQGANPEFLYYSGYAFFIGAMLFTKAAYNFHTTGMNFFLESYLDFIMQVLGIMFYMIFMQRFLDTRRHHPFLHPLYNIGIIVLSISAVAYTVLHYFTDNYPLEYTIEFVTKILLLVMVVIFLVYSIRQWKDKLLRFLFWGNLLLFIFSVLSQIFSMNRPNFKGVPDIFNSSLFYYEVGLFLELVLFLMGLNYKNRKQLVEQTKERESLKAQNLLKEYEKEIAVYKAQQEERQRISADMHDELGAGMTAIRLMSEIARNKMKENTPLEIDKISQSANDVLNNMNAIIWSMNSGNDSLDNLIYYIRTYSLEYFENTPIQCKVNIPETIPEKELTGDKRRNIFLVVKESLNNALKHSNASVLTIDISVNHKLVIKIADNGKGIDLLNLRQFGNGLKNMSRRMESIHGTFKIENNNGTVATLECSL